MCHFLPVYHLGIAFLGRGEGQNITLGPCLRVEKSMEHEDDGYINSNCCSRYSQQRIGTETGGLGNKRVRGDNPNNSIIAICQNTEKSPEDLRSLVVTQTLVGNHPQTLVLKLSKEHEDSIGKHERGLITSIRKNTDNTIDNRMTITRKQKWEEKQLYGRFKRLINNISHDKTWTWLREQNFKRAKESLLNTAQTTP